MGHGPGPGLESRPAGSSESQQTTATKLNMTQQGQELKLKEADKLFKQGQKEVSPSLFDFRLAADWERAAPLFEKAALMYRQYGAREKALEAFERAANAQERLKSPWHAAKHYEVCAELAKQTGETDQLASFYRRAADAYVTCGKPSVAAEALGRGARSMEELDSDTAIKMFMEALGLFEDSEKESSGLDIYRGCVACMIKAKRLPEAAQVMTRLALACDRTQSRASQCKSYLGAIVISLYDQDGQGAWQIFQEAMDVEAFGSSNEAYAADALFEAYRSKDAEAVQRVVTTNTAFKQLDNQVARLAIKLPVGKFKRLAKLIDSLMGGGEEEEQEEDVC